MFAVYVHTYIHMLQGWQKNTHPGYDCSEHIITKFVYVGHIVHYSMDVWHL